MEGRRGLRAHTQQYKNRFKWLRPSLFNKELARDLRRDALALLRIVQRCGHWDTSRDAKLNALADLLTERHAHEKVLIFTQFADTVLFLESQLKARGIRHLAGVTGQSPDPTNLVWRFSPTSNNKLSLARSEGELRVLIATDILSEGQNLQDCSIVVNYDLPWAIIRLIQRVGRVDRIGQQAEEINCYTFLPAEGVERIIRLRERIKERLHQNSEVIGTDEAFFDDDLDRQMALDLYHEKAGLLDGEADGEVDLASYAYEIWKNAISREPGLQKIIPELPPVVYSTRPHETRESEPEGVLVYMRTPQGNDLLAWIDREGRSITQSQLTILNAAECGPETPVLKRQWEHHQLVKKGVEQVVKGEKVIGGQLGRPSGVRFRVYERLRKIVQDTPYERFEELDRAINEIYRYPLRQSAIDTLNRRLKNGIDDEHLISLISHCVKGITCVSSPMSFRCKSQ